jgi:hypothetical protein
MTALLALIGLPRWTPYAVAVALAVAALWYSHHLGYSSAQSKCRQAELERVIYAQAESISRYRAALETSNAQREEEAAAAADRESILIARANELEAEKAAQTKTTVELESDLRAAIMDKGKADALIDRMRTARDDCRATDRDIDVDQRMRRNKKAVGR